MELPTDMGLILNYSKTRKGHLGQFILKACAGQVRRVELNCLMNLVIMFCDCNKHIP